MPSAASLKVLVATVQQTMRSLVRTVGTVVGEPAGARERGIEVRHVLAHAQPDSLASMVRAVADRALVIPIARSFPLSEIRKAQELAEKGAGGKVLLRI